MGSVCCRHVPDQGARFNCDVVPWLSWPTLGCEKLRWFCTDVTSCDAALVLAMDSMLISFLCHLLACLQLSRRSSWLLSDTTVVSDHSNALCSPQLKLAQAGISITYTIAASWPSLAAWHTRRPDCLVNWVANSAVDGSTLPACHHHTSADGPHPA